MPGRHTTIKTRAEWYPLERSTDASTGTGSNRLERNEEPIATEEWDRRRAWTCERDLVAASPDRTGSYWRRPTEREIKMLDLGMEVSDAEYDAGALEIRWLIAVTGEHPFPRQKHAVRLVERLRD